MHLTDINFAGQFNESNKKKSKKKSEQLLFYISRVYSALSISFFLSLFLPSQDITEKTMAQAFRRFPIISISLKYLRVWQKGTSFRVDRDLFRSLSNASLTMGSALLFVFSTYLPNNQPPAFSFSCPTLRPLQRGYYRDTKGPRYRTIQHRFLHLKRGTKTHIVHHKYFPTTETN